MLMIQSTIDQSILFRMKLICKPIWMLRTWSTINKLPLNAAKCVVMHITRSRRPIFVSYHMGDKHLRIVLSSNLEWGPHVDEVSSKVKRLLGFIRRSVGSNDPVTMKKLLLLHLA